MDTNEIKSILERNEVTSDVFLNVYAADELPKTRIERDRWFLVVNCCPSNSRGENWVAVFSENGQLEFFDSFGLPPDVYEGVVPFLRAQGWPEKFDATYNDEQIQSIDSDACGHYCILFGHFRARGVAYADILRHLNDIHSFSRDTIVKLIVNLVL